MLSDFSVFQFTQMHAYHTEKAFEDNFKHTLYKMSIYFETKDKK